ncbi:hypothetical protein VP01_923g4 [Puccinia sorghi]|uniref:Uncharacterized protein n=1 Tax=Puccinia sorghi TaxID=27349 RepID=A0A0L6U783_9BASI|nr:hypothetical protein VP01_923g4 [Puccinia sorghi]
MSTSWLYQFGNFGEPTSVACTTATHFLEIFIKQFSFNPFFNILSFFTQFPHLNPVRQCTYACFTDFRLQKIDILQEHKKWRDDTACNYHTKTTTSFKEEKACKLYHVWPIGMLENPKKSSQSINLATLPTNLTYCCDPVTPSGTCQGIFRAFVGLSGLTFAFVSRNKQTSIGDRESAGGELEGGFGFGGSSGNWRRIGRTRVVLEGTAGGKTGRQSAKGVRRLRSRGPEEQGRRGGKLWEVWVYKGRVFVHTRGDIYIYNRSTQRNQGKNWGSQASKSPKGRRFTVSFWVAILTNLEVFRSETKGYSTHIGGGHSVTYRDSFSFPILPHWELFFLFHCWMTTMAGKVVLSGYLFLLFFSHLFFIVGGLNWGKEKGRSGITHSMKIAGRRRVWSVARTGGTRRLFPGGCRRGWSGTAGERQPNYASDAQRRSGVPSPGEARGVGAGAEARCDAVGWGRLGELIGICVLTDIKVVGQGREYIIID